MRHRLKTVSWDLVVFFTITTVGLALALRGLEHPSFSSETARWIDGSASYAQTDLSRASALHPVVDLGCVERHEPRESFASQAGIVQIRGRFCGASQKPLRHRRLDGVKVVNLTSGQEGTIFLRGWDSSFITDFLALKSGRNVIRVEWTEPRDRLPQSVVADVFGK